ncbi:PEGA domain-containing protein [Phycisphaerales bacterium AB-hyl4]|uniref:PEGA domain-containing protein n=1 Tax=Natronomicrosphaera hydrolytica TaxID=3242702 RepID=A0ABV4UBA5_9BACT
MPRPTLLLLLLTLALTGTACVQRTIHLTSEPSGALVHLNDEEVGRTPLSVPFTFYGKYDVRLEAEAHEPLWTAARARAPWWEYPGPDLIAEMIPGMRSDIHWHFSLIPAPAAEDVDEDALRDRARELRSSSRSGD